MSEKCCCCSLGAACQYFSRLDRSTMRDDELLNSVLQAFVAAEGVLIVLGHCFVFGLFLQQGGTRGRLSDIHILSLMTSDLIHGFLNIPLVVYLTRGLRVGDPSCFWAHWFSATSGMMQIFIIISMTMDRYWAIVHPLHYKTNATPYKAFGKYLVRSKSQWRN